MKPLSILAVDDEVDFLNALVARLRLRGFTTHGVSTGEAALQYLGSNPVDVVVLDLKMPVMDGLEILQEIKKSHESAEVILLTGHGSVESAMTGVSMGAFAYLIKPVKLDELVAKIEAAYSWKQTDRKMPDPNNLGPH